MSSLEPRESRQFSLQINVDYVGKSVFSAARDGHLVVEFTDPHKPTDEARALTSTV